MDYTQGSHKTCISILNLDKELLVISKMATDFKSAKQGLKYYKGALTKAIGEFESAVKDLSKEKDNATITLSRKIRLSAAVMEKMENMGLKKKKLEEVKDSTIEVILGIEEKQLVKSREEHIGEIEKEFDKTVEEIKDLERNSEDMIVVAEEFLHGKASNPTQPVPATQAGPTTEIFRPLSHVKTRIFRQDVDTSAGDEVHTEC